MNKQNSYLLWPAELLCAAAETQSVIKALYISLYLQRHSSALSGCQATQSQKNSRRTWIWLVFDWYAGAANESRGEDLQASGQVKAEDKWVVWWDGLNFHK